MPADLWSFTLDFYARPGVEAACLRLQEQGGDVCVLLCGLWLGQRGVAFEPARLQALGDMATAWQRDVVTPLRDLRIQWRGAAAHDTALAALREQVKALELSAERTLLQRFQALAEGWPAAEVQDNEAWLGALARQDHDALHTLRVAIHAGDGQA